MAKRITSRQIKKPRQYTYDQTAPALGVSPQTMRGWRAAGFHVLTGNVPHLIIGNDGEIFSILAKWVKADAANDHAVGSEIGAVRHDR
ncbi:MAG: hypothetical protein V7695_15150 [Sulfitobacter sp.]